MLLFLGPLGGPEIILILLIALLLFGPKKLPELGRSLGKGLREFKKSTSGLMDSINEEVKAPSQPEPAPAQSAPKKLEPPTQKPPEEVEEVVINLEEGKKS